MPAIENLDNRRLKNLLPFLFPLLF